MDGELLPLFSGWVGIVQLVGEWDFKEAVYLFELDVFFGHFFYYFVGRRAGVHSPERSELPLRVPTTLFSEDCGGVWCSG